MNFSVLLSCMYQKDFSLIEQSNLKNVPALMINQCDEQSELLSSDGIHKIINTTTRGLSISRNIAIENAVSDICLISDNDEYFVDDLEQTVKKAYQDLPEADIIIFQISNRIKKLGKKVRKLKKYDLLRVSSIQITFKLNSIKNSGIKFDEKLGAGTANGGGEENKFLLDCRKNGLNIYFVPVGIALLQEGTSTWFSGHTEKTFFNRGKTTAYILGRFTATLYAFYFLIFKHKNYKKDISFFRAAKYLFKGIRVKDIDAKFN